MTITALVQAGGATVAALLAYVLGFRLLLPSLQRAYRSVLEAQREQLQDAREELARMQKVHLALEGEIAGLKMELARHGLTALDLEARVARLQRDLKVQTSELASERRRSLNRLRAVQGLAQRNAELEQQRDVRIRKSMDAGSSSD